MLDLMTQQADTALMTVQIFVCFVIIFVVIPLHEWTAKTLSDPILMLIFEKCVLMR